MASEKQKEKKKIKQYAEKGREITAVSGLAGYLGGYGAYALQRILMDDVAAQNEPMPIELGGEAIHDLKSHFSQRAKDIGNVKLKSSIKPEEFSKNLDEIASLGESFAKAHKLRESGVGINIPKEARSLGDYYNPIKNTVNIHTANPAVALHEMGHAADIRGSMVKTVGRHLPAGTLAMAIPAALAYGDIVKEKIPGSVDDKVIDFIQEHPVALGMGGYTSSVLYPEAKASYLALKHIAKESGKDVAAQAFKKTLGPAYGTYLAGAIPLSLGLWAGKKYKDIITHKKRTPQEKRAYIAHMTKEAMGPNAKAFLAGFLGAGIPVSAATAYSSATRGGKLIGDVQLEAIKQEEAIGRAEPGSYFINKSSKDWREKNPALATAIIGGGVGTVGGLFTMLGMKRLPLFKNRFNG